MPTREWNLRATGTAKYGLNWTQSGRTLRVTVQKWRQSSATWWNDPTKITVYVGGASPGSRATASSTANSLPSGMESGKWLNTAAVNLEFTLPLATSSVDIRVLGEMNHSGYINFDHTETISVTPQYSAPAAPTDLTATRSSGTVAALAWTRNATGAAPYSSQQVYRYENDGPAIDVAALPGGATSYSAATVANKKYRFRIQARNAAGSANSSLSNILLTTPAKLASLAAAVVSGGIRLTLSKLEVPYNECEVVVEMTTNGGSSWSTVHTFAASALSRSTTTQWTHTSAPTSGTVRYRATVKTTGGTQGVLSSAVTLSNAMTLNVPPLAPTDLSPSGTVDITDPVVLKWSHRASSDGAAQSSRQIQYSTNGGTSQTNLVTGNSTAQSYSWSVNTGMFAPGQTVLWRVRTAGSQPGTYGAWSVWQSITLHQAVAVAVTGPSGTWVGGDMTVTWVVTPMWGSASQVAYRLVMESSNGVAFDTGTVASSASSATVPASAQRDGTVYTITVTVTDSNGLQALPASTVVTTSFLEPGAVNMTWLFDDDLGQLVVTPEFDALTPDPLDDTVSWMLERSLDGVTFEPVGVFDGDGPVSDGLVRIGADSWYRTTGYTALGVAGERSVFFVPANDVVSRWGRLSYGEDFGLTVRFGWSQTLDVSTGRASESYEIEGRDYPADVYGRPLFDKTVISGKLQYGVPRERRNVGVAVLDGGVWYADMGAS